MARYLSEDDVAYLIDENLEISLHSMTLDVLVNWLDERFESVGLRSKFIPEDDDLRTNALKLMKAVLRDWVFHRIREVTHADYLADRVMWLLSSDLKAEHFSTELMTAIYEQPSEAWLSMGQDLAQKRCQEVLLNRQVEIEELLKKHGFHFKDKGN